MLRSLNRAFIDRGFLVRPDTIKCKYIPMLLDKVYEFVEKQKSKPIFTFIVLLPWYSTENK